MIRSSVLSFPEYHCLTELNIYSVASKQVIDVCQVSISFGNTAWLLASPTFLAVGLLT